MKKKYLLTTVVVFLFVLPIQAQDAPQPDQKQGPERIKSASEAAFLKALKTAGRNLNLQGVYIESLDGSLVLADHRSTAAFNPASVIKIATSFAALDRFGPDHEFETALLADGEIDKKTKTLKGDLVLLSTGDPDLAAADVASLLKQVTAAGITRVTGSLVLAGPIPFTYASFSSSTRSVANLEAALKKRGIRITKRTRKGAVAGTPVASHRSQPLRDIVFVQNAYSDNLTADRLGDAIGGPRAVKRFLVEGIGIPAADVSVERASGLGRNRITPRGTVLLLRHLVLWLNLRNMLPQDVLPVAGSDVGTLRSRFTATDYRGAVVGKTGTLPRTDGGVSTLAGFVYTRDRGVLVFAIFTTGSSVNRARTLQDNFLKSVIAEFGGAELSASSRRSSN
jgi:D-alanyl-D-alanine carboxypeptidase/D-alanyl-D-alanine-endopeptidase (penicillin-binding protein 4)